jgi:hypothetical protein
MPDSLANQPPQPRPSLWSRPAFWLILLLLLLLALLGANLFRAALATRAVLADLRTLDALDTDALASLGPADLAALRVRFASIEANLAVVEHHGEPLLPILNRLGWLPGIGEELAAAPELLQLASSMATAGRAALEGAGPVLAAFQSTGEGSAMARMLPALAGSAAHWQQAEQALAQAAEVRAQLDTTGLDPRLASQLSRLDAYLPDLQAAVGLGQVAPALLGAAAPRSYLLLAQNSDELRPTGGFISGVGLVTLDGGEIGELDFQDSYAIYNPNVDHPRAPVDLEQYMLAQMLLVRDANWSPDFPTTSAVVQSLYLLDTGRNTDGVIAFDVEAVRRVVAALEPLALPGYAEPLTSANLTTALQQVWAAPADTEGTVVQATSSDWWTHRKDFMGDLAAGARAKLESGQVDFGKLAWAIRSSLDEKHLLVALNDRAVMQAMAQAGWNGGLVTGDGDYLFVVDTNVGWNKVNVIVTRDTHYRVTPGPDGSAQAELTLVYRHGGQPTTAPCEHVARYGDTYQDMVQRCYFNYLRVYVPAEVTLLSAEGMEPETVQSFPGEQGTTVLAGYVVVPAGQEHQVRLTYQLPPATVGNDVYRLNVQKQAGTPPWPMLVDLLAPGGGWQPVTPSGQATAAGVSFAFDLATDTGVIARRTN